MQKLVFEFILWGIYLWGMTTSHPSAHRPLNRLAAPTEAIRGFTPNWFTACMGTGIVSLMLPKLPLPGTAVVGEGLWIFNMVLFTVFTLMSLARVVLYPADSRATLHHPVQSMFLGAVPMGLATIVNGFITFGVLHWGESAAILARDLWAFDAVLSAIIGLFVPYLMFTRQDHALEKMTAVWLLPVVASEGGRRQRRVDRAAPERGERRRHFSTPATITDCP